MKNINNKNIIVELKEDLETLHKNHVHGDNKLSMTEKIIQMSQEAINKAEETLSAPGSYNKQFKTYEFNYNCN